MLLHTIIAADEILLDPTPPKPVIKRLNGRLVECEEGTDGYRVRRLISTDPRDYLDARFSPAAVFDKPDEDR